MRAPEWLTAQPVAHRGLHDLSKGIVENTPSSCEAATRAGYGIEVDLQLTADGEAMVHHDDGLGRLTDGQGLLRDMTAAQLKAVPFRATNDRMMTLGELCDLVSGRVPLVLEIKSIFDGDRRLVHRAAEVLSAYRGPVSAMSFDPDQVLALRTAAPGIPRGIVAERNYDGQYWNGVSTAQKRDMLHLRHGLRTRPHFVAYSVNDLPAVAPWIARHVFGCALLTWTVRTPQQRKRAERWADQMIFEGFIPN
jgi:glycerophosphoryl diester phosphodiesterase